MNICITASRLKKAKEVRAECKHIMNNAAILVALEADIKQKIAEIKKADCAPTQSTAGINKSFLDVILSV